MNTADVIRMFRNAGVTLFLDPDRGRLKYRAPLGAMTPYMRATLREYLPEIVFIFNERAAIMEYDGGLPRKEAERCAADMLLSDQQRGKAMLSNHELAGEIPDCD